MSVEVTSVLTTPPSSTTPHHGLKSADFISQLNHWDLSLREEPGSNQCRKWWPNKEMIKQLAEYSTEFGTPKGSKQDHTTKGTFNKNQTKCLKWKRQSAVAARQQTSITDLLRCSMSVNMSRSCKAAWCELSEANDEQLPRQTAEKQEEWINELKALRDDSGNTKKRDLKMKKVPVCVHQRKG